MTIQINKSKEYIEELKKILSVVNRNRNLKTDIRVYLRDKRKISYANIENLLNLKNIDENNEKELIILGDALFNSLDGVDNIDPKKFFVENTIKQVLSSIEQDRISYDISFPLVLEGFTKMSEYEYSGTVDAQFLNLLLDSGNINYNKAVQRDLVKERTSSGQIIELPFLNMKNVNEIAKLYANNQLFSTTITLNCRTGTANEGIELEYDEKSKQIIINEGTLIDCIDGFHRLNGISIGQKINPNSNMKFILLIGNMTEKIAKERFVQQNKGEGVSKQRLFELAEEDNTTKLINNHISTSKFGKYIVHNTKKMKGSFNYKEIYDLLLKYFGELSRTETIIVGRYLNEIFAEYAEIIEDEKKIFEIEKVIKLAKHMHENNIPANEFAIHIEDLV